MIKLILKKISKKKIRKAKQQIKKLNRKIKKNKIRMKKAIKLICKMKKKSNKSFWS